MCVSMFFYRRYITIIVSHYNKTNNIHFLFFQASDLRFYSNVSDINKSSLYIYYIFFIGCTVRHSFFLVQFITSLVCYSYKKTN